MKKLEEAGINNAIKFYMVYEEERKILEDENENNLDQTGEKSLVIMMESGECSMGEFFPLFLKFLSSFKVYLPIIKEDIYFLLSTILPLNIPLTPSL